jgi:hypothetical protein
MTDTDTRDVAGSVGPDLDSPGRQARLAELYRDFAAAELYRDFAAAELDLFAFSDAPVFEKLNLLRTEVTGY